MILETLVSLGWIRCHGDLGVRVSIRMQRCIMGSCRLPTFSTGTKINCEGLKERWVKESEWSNAQKVSIAVSVSRGSAQHSHTAVSLANTRKHYTRVQLGQPKRTCIHHIDLYTLEGNFNISMLQTRLSSINEDVITPSRPSNSTLGICPRESTRTYLVCRPQQPH